MLIAIGAYLRLRNAWTDLDLLSRTTLPDDAFYDFAIARNIAAGKVPSIDGVHATNGYHPLWVAILTVIYRFSNPNDARTPIHVALTLGALCDVGALWVLHRIARKARMATGAIVAVGVVSLSAYATVNATCGLETPLALLLVLLVVDRHLRATVADDARWFAISGALSGLSILARTDAVVIASGILGVAAWRAGKDSRSRVRLLAIACGTMTLVVLPWLAYSWRTTGTVVQSSALALALVANRLPLVWGFQHVSFALRAERALASLREGMWLTALFFGIGSTAIAAAAVALGAGAAFGRRLQRRLLRRQLARLAPFLVGLSVLFLLHVLVRMVYRSWYTAPMIVGLALVLGLAVEHCARAAPGRWVVTIALAVALAGCLWRETRLWEERGLYGLADYRGMNPADVLHEGHTDCGAVAYFHRAGIVNLDGVVNDEALAHLRAGTLLEYLRDERFERVYATDHFHSSVFFGARYRESLRTSEHDVRAVRLVVDDAEKDALIGVDSASISLGGVAGRELLSDGWLWASEPPPLGWATSVGETSELVFVLPPTSGSHPELELELRAAVVDDVGEQSVDVDVDGRFVTTWHVLATPGWFTAPIADARPGRHRLVLRYRAARAVRQLGSRATWDWWRSLRGNLVRAVDANGIRLARASDRQLPPIGPTLAEAASDRLFLSGWLPVERDGTTPGIWAIGRRAELVFWSDGSSTDRSLTLRAGPPPPDDERADQQVTIALNGRPLGAIDLPPSMISTVSVAVPAATLAVGENHLVLTFARTASEPGGSIARAAYFQSIELH